MADDSDKHKLPILTIEGTNNYTTWDTKAKASLEAWDYWKYIDGNESTALVIPERILDVPSQRLYYLSLGLLCQVRLARFNIRYMAVSLVYHASP